MNRTIHLRMWYCVDATPRSNKVTEEFPEIAAAGFNLIQSYHFEGVHTATDEDAKAYLDAAQRAGLRVQLGIQQEAVQDPQDPQKQDLAIIEQRVRTLKGHPALFGWHLYDEPENPAYGRGQPVNVDHFLRAYQTIKRLDTSHPVVGLPAAAIDDQYEYLNGADWLMLQYSMLPEGIYDHPWASLEQLREAHQSSFSTLASKGMPFLWVFQAYNLANDPDMWPDVKKRVPNAVGRYPTREEMRFMAYSGILQGAKGVIFNCYRTEDGNGKSLEDISRENNPSQWEAVSSVSKELKEMAPILLAPTQERRSAGVTLTGGGSVEMLIKQHQGKTYLLTVNTLKRPVQRQIRLARDRFPNPTVTLLPQRQRISFDRGSLDAQWSPYEVRVYEITSVGRP
ncbi:MAG: hypothetical protein HYZ73_05070 [Elusimicrobia bacterium]|nr:hypothetical protein [Elusimicrobiota bacterium]